MLERQIKDKLAELQRQMDFGVSVNAEILNQIGFVPKENLAATFPPKKKTDTAIKIAGGAIGSILGSFSCCCFDGLGRLIAENPFIGYRFIGFGLPGVPFGRTGGLAGSAKDCVKTLTQYDQLDVNTVTKALNQHIATAMSDVSAIVGNTVAALRDALSHHAVVNDAYIMITGQTISDHEDILPLLEQTVRSHKNLVIIAENVENYALLTLYNHYTSSSLTAVCRGGRMFTQSC